MSKTKQSRSLAQCPECKSTLIFAWRDPGQPDEWKCAGCGWTGDHWPVDMVAQAEAERPSTTYGMDARP